MHLAIFDIDGTLTNTNAVDNECFVKALAEAHTITEVDTDWSAYPHTTDSGITQHIFQERFGRSPEATELDKLKSCFISLLSGHYHASPSGFAEIAGAGVALARLQREADWAVALATGCWRVSASLKLRAAGIEVDGIPAAYAEDGLSREEILLAAVALSVERYGPGSFEKIVSIGDGLWDVRTARRLNFSFLGVGRGESAARLRLAGAKHVIEDFADYDRLLGFLNEATVPAATDAACHPLSFTPSL